MFSSLSSKYGFSESKGNWHLSTHLYAERESGESAVYIWVLDCQGGKEVHWTAQQKQHADAKYTKVNKTETPSQQHVSRLQQCNVQVAAGSEASCALNRDATGGFFGQAIGGSVAQESSCKYVNMWSMLNQVAMWRNRALQQDRKWNQSPVWTLVLGVFVLHKCFSHWIN